MPIPSLTTFTNVVDRKVNTLLDGIATIRREARAAGAGDALINEMCEPYYDLLRNVLVEDYPLGESSGESRLLAVEQVEVLH